MKTLNLTAKIMRKIANEEEGRLKRTLKIVVPSIILLVLAILATLYLTATNILESGVFDILRDIDYAREKILPQLIDASIFIWDELEKNILIALLLALVLIYAIIWRTKLTSFPKRLREIKKYK